MLNKPTELDRIDSIAYLIATWFGCGLVPFAPGTAGSLGALPLYLLLRTYGRFFVALGLVVVTIAGLWASHRVSLRLAQKDPQIICVDEVAGVLLTWLAVPNDWSGIITGFIAFRVADQLKPWPANVAERAWPGGWGIMFDDLFAAGWAAAIVLSVRTIG